MYELLAALMRRFTVRIDVSFIEKIDGPLLQANDQKRLAPPSNGSSAWDTIADLDAFDASIDLAAREIDLD